MLFRSGTAPIISAGGKNVRVAADDSIMAVSPNGDIVRHLQDIRDAFVHYAKTPPNLSLEVDGVKLGKVINNARDVYNEK